jgi:hypothetical protein
MNSGPPPNGTSCITIVMLLECVSMGDAEFEWTMSRLSFPKSRLPETVFSKFFHLKFMWFIETDQ